MTSFKLAADHRFGFFDATESSPQLFNPVLVDNAGSNTMLKAILAELRRSNRFVFSVAFISSSAVSLLKQALTDYDGEATIVTSTYLGFNSPGVFRELIALENVEVRVLPDGADGFHAKGYVFEQDGTHSAIVGSSNMTANALIRNREWNLRFSALPDGDIINQINHAIDCQILQSNPLTERWIADYEATWISPPKRGSGAVTLPAGSVVANRMQEAALGEIRKCREGGNKRAVVVSATGTGKTILAALDVRSFNPTKMLFIVHREQIIDRAIDEFARVLGVGLDQFGKFVGGKKETDRKYVFATVQSLSKTNTLEAIDPRLFDYVLIDEVHRAGAGSYRRIIDHLQPDFILGVTATPERSDDYNIFELFDYNVPYEIRLNDALDNNMLVPFHYFGVADYESNGQVIDDVTSLARLVMPERADHIVRALERYGHRGEPVRGLIFCSRNEEAADLSGLLNSRTVGGSLLRTVSLSGGTSIPDREAAVASLARGELDYLLTVDIFNEGIDIPSVNQIVMLRQTQSSIVFTQQLGRGLRKFPGKEHLVVIDFIGNYTNNYLIPVAIFGDDSLNRDSLKRRIIEASDVGAIQGVSAVNFDTVSRDRVLQSIATTKLDSKVSLKRATVALRDRIGELPMLFDFARFDSIDPVVIGGQKGNLWATMVWLGLKDELPEMQDSEVLTFLTVELLNGKRLHELILLEVLLERSAVSADEYRAMLRIQECVHDEPTLRSVLSVLDLSFFIASERAKYGDRPLVETRNGSYYLADWLRDGLDQRPDFKRHFSDVIRTGLYIGRNRYDWRSQLTVGQKYTRKDACRLLNWESNGSGTVYGYKVDVSSGTCPLFITLHKDEDIAESTRYDDGLVNESTIRWFSKSNRNLSSGELKPIIGNRVDLHVFVKKDDSEGTDFFYLGRAMASDPLQKQMRGTANRTLDVVTMTLTTEVPIDLALYDYLAGIAD